MLRVKYDQPSELTNGIFVVLYVKWTPVLGPLDKVDFSDLESICGKRISWLPQEVFDVAHTSSF